MSKHYGTFNMNNLTKEQRVKLANLRTTHFRQYGGAAKFPAKVIGARGPKGSTNQQAIRTGGWANPSKGGELKFCDVSVSQAVTFNAVTFGAGVLLNAIAQGTDASNRIGRKITIKSLLIRMQWKLGGTSTFGSPLRVLVVYDKQANATAPAITDVLALDEFFSCNNLANRDRFVTIFDNMMEPISVGGNAAVADVLYKRLNLETMYNSGTDALIGSISSGSIYLFVAQGGNLLTANGNFNARCRIRYTDV